MGGEATASADPLGVNASNQTSNTADPLGVRQFGPPKKTNALAKIGSVLDVPLSYMGAWGETPSANPMDTVRDLGKATDLLRRSGPEAMNEEYLPFGSKYIERHKATDPVEGLMSKSPLARGAVAFGTEMLANPSNLVLNPVISHTVGPVLGLLGKGLTSAKILGKQPGEEVARAFDRFREIRQVGGVEGETAARNMLGGAQKADQEAVNTAEQIFGPVEPTTKIGKLTSALKPRFLTQAEKIEIVRLSQGLPSQESELALSRQNPASYPKLQEASENAIRERIPAAPPDTRTGKNTYAALPPGLLAQRAKLLRTTLKGLDYEQMNAHPDLLAAGRRFNPETYFPMSGQYRDKNLSDEAAQFMEDFRPGSSGMQTVKGTASKTGPHKSYLTMDDALKSGLLKEDFDPAQALYQHLSRRGRNVSFEHGIQAMPESLAKLTEYARPASSGQALMAQHLKPSDFAHWGKQAPEQFAKATKGMEPILPGPHVTSEDVQKVLGSSPSAAERTFHPALVSFLQKAGAQPAEANAFSTWLGRINTLTRIGEITNPLVHPAWNLMNNYLAGGGDAKQLGYVATGKGLEDAEKWEQLAETHGAHVHMAAKGLAGGDAARLLTGGGNALERLGTRAWNANQKLVFDTFEKRFGTALFKGKAEQFIAKGMDEREAMMRAGLDVRKALGDYLNVNPDGIEAVFNKALYFYPWLKTTIPFWAKAAVEHPQNIQAPMHGVQAWNEGMGAPSDSNNPTNPRSLYLGKDKNNKDQYITLPLPWGNFGDVAESVAPGGDIGAPLDAHLKPLYKLLLGHANVGLGLGADFITTLAQTAREPGGADMHTLFNRDAPLKESARQFLANAGARFVPSALLSAPGVISDLASGHLASGAGIGGGFEHSRPSAVVSKIEARLWDKTASEIAKYRKFGRNDLAERVYWLYRQRVQQLENPHETGGH